MRPKWLIDRASAPDYTLHPQLPNHGDAREAAAATMVDCSTFARRGQAKFSPLRDEAPAAARL
jgi:hypothetical protein